MIKLAVIGNPVKHSYSPWLHKEFAKQFDMDIEFDSILSPVDQFKKYVLAFQKKGGQGLAVTMPFKHDAFDLADTLTERAKLAGSVSCMKLHTDGTIEGDNTDGAGLVNDIQNNCHYDIANKRVLIIGAGGAAQGIIPAIQEKKPQSVFIVNRTTEKAAKLGKQFSCESGGFDDLKNKIFDLLIDTTGFDSELPFPDELILSDNAFCYDIKAHADVTDFMQWGQSKGAKHLANGLGMGIEQGVEAFYLWTGKKANSQPIILAKQQN